MVHTKTEKKEPLVALPTQTSHPVMWVSRTAGNPLPSPTRAQSTTIAFQSSPACALPVQQESANAHTIEIPAVHSATPSNLAEQDTPEIARPNPTSQYKSVDRSHKTTPQSHAPYQQTHTPSTTQTTAQKPATTPSVTKRALTLAQLAQGFTQYMANGQTNLKQSQTDNRFTGCKGTASGKISALQLMMERCLEKMGQSIQTNIDHSSHAHPIIEPSMNVGTLQLVICYSHESKAYTISLVTSSGYQDIDNHYIRVITEASRSFAPIPVALCFNGHFSFPVTIAAPVKNKVTQFHGARFKR